MPSVGHLAVAALQDEETTARYFELAALARGLEVTRIAERLAARTLAATDLLLVVDPWGADLASLASAPCTTAAFLIDVHQELQTRLLVARYVDHVFVAQPDYIPEFRNLPHSSVHWLPLACDPDIHFIDGLERVIEVGFVGKLGNPGSERRTVLERVLSEFETNARDRRYSPRELGKAYSSSKIVFNKSINGDVNMRVFEAMASGALLVTDRIGNGLSEIAREGEHYVGYDDAEEAIEAIRHYLRDDAARHMIARAGQALAFERHTYGQRLGSILDVVADDRVLRAPARFAPRKVERSWLAQWYRLRGVGATEGLRVLLSGQLPPRAVLNVGLGVARRASRTAKALLSSR